MSKTHIRMYMILEHMFEIHLVLTKYCQQINVISYQMLQYLSIRLTEIETIHILMSTHAEKRSDVLLFLTCYIIEYNNGIRHCIVGCNYLLMFTEGNVERHLSVAVVPLREEGTDFWPKNRIFIVLNYFLAISLLKNLFSMSKFSYNYNYNYLMIINIII